MEQFTWGQFGMFILALLVVYYTFILFYYYSGELNTLIGGRRNPSVKADNIVPAPVIGSPLAAPVQPISYKDEEPDESEEGAGETVPDPDQQVLIDSQEYDFEEAFNKDYHEADPDQLPELEELVTEGDVEPDADELGVEADDYINATSLISKPEIPAEQIEPVKSTVGKILFNESVLKQYQLSSNAHSNIDTMISQLEAEGMLLPETKTAFINYNSTGDDDMQKLLETLN